MALCSEYTHRYGKVHASEAVIRALREPPIGLPEGELTPFVQAMPDYCKRENATHAYQTYYVEEKQEICKWTKRKPPPFMLM